MDTVLPVIRSQRNHGIRFVIEGIIKGELLKKHFQYVTHEKNIVLWKPYLHLLSPYSRHATHSLPHFKKLKAN